MLYMLPWSALKCGTYPPVHAAQVGAGIIFTIFLFFPSMSEQDIIVPSPLEALRLLGSFKYAKRAAAGDAAASLGVASTPAGPVMTPGVTRPLVSALELTSPSADKGGGIDGKGEEGVSAASQVAFHDVVMYSRKPGEGKLPSNSRSKSEFRSLRNVMWLVLAFGAYLAGIVLTCLGIKQVCEFRYGRLN